MVNMSEVKFAVFVKNETVAQSIFKDVVTAVMVSFCVYISGDSTWWTFVTGLMFIAFCVIRFKRIVADHVNEFKTKEELKSWVENLEGDE